MADENTIENLLERVKPVAKYGQLAISSNFPATAAEAGDAVSFEKGFGEKFGGEAGSLQGKLRVLLPDLNRLAEIATREQYFREIGGIRTFSQEFSDAVGGYPNRAMLEYWNGSRLRRVMSLRDNNTANFVTNPNFIGDGRNWSYCDEWSPSNMRIYLDLKNAQVTSVGLPVPFDCLMLISISATFTTVGTGTYTVEWKTPGGLDDGSSVILSSTVTAANLEAAPSHQINLADAWGRYFPKGTVVTRKAGETFLVDAQAFVIPLVPAR